MTLKVNSAAMDVCAVPGWAGLLIITFSCVAIACGGHVVVKRSFAKTDFIEHNEVGGFIVAVVGVLYAVLLGFITVIVWEHDAQSEERAQAEVQVVADLRRHRVIVLLDYPFRGDVSVSPERWFALHEAIAAKREATHTGTR